MTDGTGQERTNHRDGVLAGIRSWWRCGATDPANAGPRVIWRLKRWSVILGFVPMIAGLGAELSGKKSMAGVPPMIAVIAMFPVVMVVGFYVWRRIGRWQRQAQETEFQVCPECGYSLEGLAESGTCAECGTGYSRLQLAEVWTRA